MPNIIINGGTITQTVTGGGEGQKSIVLRTKDTYVLEDIQVNVSASAPVGTFSNSISGDPSAYPINDSDETVIPAGGSLYLSGGWYPKQQIKLGHLIPEIANDDAGRDHILQGYSAFDENGNQITGTIITGTPNFDGGDVSTTATLHYTAPSATISAVGKFVPGSGADQLGDEYGITAQEPSGTEGTDYLYVGANIGTINDGSVYASSTANRTAVLYNGNVHYFVDKGDDTVALAAPSTNATNQSATQNININSIVTNGFGKYYIPIVKPQGSGGGVSKTGQSGTVTCTLDNVRLASSGGFTEVGTGGAGANYGVHSYTPDTQNPNPSGTDGTDYLKIQTSGSGGRAIVTGTIDVAYRRNAVNAGSTYKGLVSMSTSTKLLNDTTGTLAANVSTTGTPTIIGGSYYYIDIVKPKGSAPSITATGISDTLAFPSNGAPYVESYIKGNILPGDQSDRLGDGYGVTATRPGGTNGTDYLTIEAGASTHSGTLSGDTTITFTRGAVNANATYKGAVSMTTSTELVAQATGQTVTQSLSKTITPTATLGNNLYIPISTPVATGGDLTGDSITITANGSPTSGVTPSVGLFSKSGNNPQGTTAVDSTYGVQTTAPTSGDWVVLDPDAAVGNVDISASISIGRSAVSVSGHAGLYNGTGTGLAAITQRQFTGSSSVSIPVKSGQSKYVPVVSSATMSGGALPATTSVTPTVGTGTGTSGTNNIEVKPKTNLFLRGAGSDTAISSDDEQSWGIVGSTDNNKKYVVLDPDATAGDHKTVHFSKSITRPDVKATIGAGITAGFTETLAAETKTYSGDTTIGTSIQAGTNRYIVVVHPSANNPTFSSVTNPTVTTTTSAKKKVGSASPTTAPSGVLTSTTAPSDLSTYSAGYIIVSPGSSSSSNGSITARATASIDAGITQGGTSSAASSTYSTISATVNNDNGAKTYIKIYDMSYDVDGSTQYGTVS